MNAVDSVLPRSGVAACCRCVASCGESVAVALFAAIGTRAVAKYGFGRPDDD
jgi:hypothetical protein